MEMIHFLGRRFCSRIPRIHGLCCKNPTVANSNCSRTSIHLQIGSHFSATSSQSKNNKISFWKYLSTPSLHIAAAPVAVQPYLRLIRYDKPTGTWLVFLPGAWSLALATPFGFFPDPSLAAVFSLGAFLMRSSGCIINDMFDKDLDQKVERTASRPLASGEISPFNALALLSCTLTGSLACLLQLNDTAIIIGALSILPVTVYPLMKRFTYWPQAFLGITINWGALMGGTAVLGMVNWNVALPLYVGCISWTLYYDTIYAHQDKMDDMVAGVKSTALLFKESSKLWLSSFAACSVLMWSIAGRNADQPLAYFCALSLCAHHFLQQIRTLDENNPEDCWRKFVAQKNMGLFLLGAIILGTYFCSDDSEETSSLMENLRNFRSRVADSFVKIKSGDFFDTDISKQASTGTGSGWDQDKNIVNIKDDENVQELILTSGICGDEEQSFAEIEYCESFVSENSSIYSDDEEIANSSNRSRESDAVVGHGLEESSIKQYRNPTPYTLGKSIGIRETE